MLAIDFGTSTSSGVAAGAFVEDPADGSFAWPSAVFWDGAALLVGGAAQRRRRSDPAAYRDEFKRLLGEDDPVLLGDRAFRPVELVTALLSALRVQAGDRSGHVVLTVPAAFVGGDPRGALMIAAAEAAGFTTVELVPEPVAAAWAPLPQEPLRDGQTLLVYDLGGGTFDAAVVRGGTPAHTVLGHASLDDLGGRDIDAILSARIRAESEEWLAPMVTAASGSALRVALATSELARTIKHQLTDAPEAEEFLMPTAPAFRLDRAAFDAAVADLVERTVDCCMHLLRRLDLDRSRLDGILLAGGGSRMPVVATALRRAFDRPLIRTADPGLAVVQGAAAWAAAVDRRLPGLLLDDAPLAWDFPGGSATLLRWHSRPGAVARVRLASGALLDLAGTAVTARYASPGDTVASGAWLATTSAPVPAAEPVAELPDVEDAAPFAEFDHGQGAHVSRVAFRPDGQQFVTVTSDDVVQVWDVSSGRCVSTLRPAQHIRSVHFGADGRLRFTGVAEVVTCRADSGSVIGRQPVLSHDYWYSKVTGAPFAADGRILGVIAGSVGVDVLDLDGDPVPRKLFGLTRQLRGMHLDPSGTLVAVVAGNEGQLWDVHTDTMLYSTRVEDVELGNAVAFDLDHRLFALVGGVDGEGSVRITDPVTGRVLATFTHPGTPQRVEVAPTGSLVAVSWVDGEIWLIDPQAGAVVRRLRPGRKGASAPATFSPDGRRLLVCGRRMALFDVAAP
ncbi:Hsp70 family protein [Dactylosporangium sp. AC04546]|uniref:Hsp70 family protein n=1 Tax=Dactylosporangium sp. AC04546 TaxID=2862460 RepID=UPI001EDEA895|nr:Hsp70 family protein [Dactylosporangium sp. AC04546]WVK87347.1 Hsp70 family protein [Dactylosporangium sp. AC04546]